MDPELEAALPTTWYAPALSQHILENGHKVVVAVDVGTRHQQYVSNTEDVGGRQAATDTRAKLGATTPDGTGAFAGVRFSSSAGASGEHKVSFCCGELLHYFLFRSDARVCAG